MIPLSVEQLCHLTDGVPVGDLQMDAVVDNVVVDSRKARLNSAFFALQGSRVHGIQFAAEALTRKACVVVADSRIAADCPTACVVVPDSLKAIGQLAQHNRRQSEALVIGVTGSVGKTTTRGMVCSVLNTAYQGIQSPRNFNNHLGVPLSLLQLSAGDDFAVIELAASAPGEIAPLARVAQPDFAVVTRIAPAHLDGFGSLKIVQQTKGELVKSLTADGVAFLNADDPLVRRMTEFTRTRTILFGEADDADVKAEFVHLENQSLSVVVDSQPFTAPVCGRHHLTAMLAAISVGRELGLTTQQINDGLSRFVPETGRCGILKVGLWTVIDDTYNASPAGVAAAADVLQNWSTTQRRLLVLGDMLALGDQAEEFHYSVGVRLAQASIDHFLIFGQHANATAEGFLESGGQQNRISVFEDFPTMLTMLDCLLSPGDVLLVKGSRSLQMERVISALHDVEQQPTTIALTHPTLNRQFPKYERPTARRA